MEAGRKVVVAGGGAAGFFAAIAAAESGAAVTLLEKGGEVLTKVRISGGGRCNVTHACFDPRELATRYPRGGRALIGPFHRFQSRDTIEWFERRGVALKTEFDGRMFPTTDSSATIIECLQTSAERAGVLLFTRRGLEKVERLEAGFQLNLTDGSEMKCDALILATGGPRGAGAAEIAADLGHTLEPPVPSLFTLHIETPWLRELPGLAVEDVEVSIPGTKLRERGPMLITHWGVSGPAILRLSAWGARELHARDYQFPLRVRWLPGHSPDRMAAELDAWRRGHPSRLVGNSPIDPLPARLWEQLVLAAGIDRTTQWTRLPREARIALTTLLLQTELPVTGKSMNKEEFVTCGGVRLPEIDFRTMESRVCPNLYVVGEALDIDGVTGGFNFQAAWTTGWIAGHSAAGC